jgi:DNA-directed RNA polymerase subunit M/transcription elongation factor TFIIS
MLIFYSFSFSDKNFSCDKKVMGHPTVKKVLFDVKDACKKKNWKVSNKSVQRWAEKTHQILVLYKTESLAMFKLVEIMHYVTLQDLKDEKVGVQRDDEVLKNLFQNKKNITPEPSIVLTLPEVTFNQDIKGIKCPRCKSSDNTITYSRQTRSADEPTDHFGECSGSAKKRCTYTWKIK